MTHLPPCVFDDDLEDETIPCNDYHLSLVERANRIVAGISDEEPSIAMLEAVLQELAWARQALDMDLSFASDDIPF